MKMENYHKKGTMYVRHAFNFNMTYSSIKNATTMRMNVTWNNSKSNLLYQILPLFNEYLRTDGVTNSKSQLAWYSNWGRSRALKGTSLFAIAWSVPLYLPKMKSKFVKQDNKHIFSNKLHVRIFLIMNSY